MAEKTVVKEELRKWKCICKSQVYLTQTNKVIYPGAEFTLTKFQEKMPDVVKAREIGHIIPIEPKKEEPKKEEPKKEKGITATVQTDKIITTLNEPPKEPPKNVMPENIMPDSILAPKIDEITLEDIKTNKKYLLPADFDNLSWQDKRKFVRDDLNDVDLLKVFAFDKLKAIKEAAIKKLEKMGVSLN
ncbi:MAG: hypothetical protein WC783_01010 [Candidatus Paceibacterota bacterium]|jgi:hypothetical protein